MAGKTSSLIVKIAERCNLNCSYCYMYNHEDQSFLSRPRFMSEETFDQLLLRVREYCDRHASRMRLVFHGGEPTLIGPARLEKMAERAREVLGERLDGLGMQTNATLINEEWLDVMRRQGVKTGVSLDGDADVHDLVRVDHGGRGSHAATLKGLRLMQEANLLGGILCVINPGQSGLDTFRYFRSLGLKTIDFLLPDVSHDNKKQLYGGHGPTPVADYLIPIFDEWFDADDPEVRLEVFRGLLKGIMGGRSSTDAFGNPLMSYLIIETDGAIQAVDTLKVCEEGLTDSGLNIFEHGFDDLAEGMPLVHRMVHEGLPLSAQCRACPEEATCGGGYVPHRYSRARGFDNPSVWCEDILKVVTHIRRRTGLQRATRSPLLDVEHPVLFFHNGKGDHILNLPAVRALASLYPHRLTLVCQRGAHELYFKGLPFRQVLETGVRVEGEWKFDVDVAEAIPECGLFMSLVPWQTDALKSFVKRLAPKVTVGFFNNYDIALPLDYDRHSADLAFSLPRYLDPSLRFEDFAEPPAFPVEAQSGAGRMLDSLPPGARVLVVHADTVEEKMWSAAKFVAVLDTFLERHPNFIALVVGGEPQPLDTGRHKERVIIACGLPLALTYCLAARADLFLGVDSCILHAADFCRVPGVGLFGPTDPKEFGYRLTPHRHVQGNAGMDSIGVGEVEAALESLLEEVGLK
ncbi:MAG TPA: radical SAM protein [Pyrinomonadaceae bacterium]|nr:radical SAM protein [Pyrinomonadaceae bacterium]